MYCSSFNDDLVLYLLASGNFLSMFIYFIFLPFIFIKVYKTFLKLICKITVKLLTFFIKTQTFCLSQSGGC